MTPPSLVLDPSRVPLLPTPVRLVALRKSQAAAEKEQELIRHEAICKGRRPSPDSLRAAHFTYLITDLPTEVLPAGAGASGDKLGAGPDPHDPQAPPFLVERHLRVIHHHALARVPLAGHHDLVLGILAVLVARMEEAVEGTAAVQLAPPLAHVIRPPAGGAAAGRSAAR